MCRRCGEPDRRGASRTRRRRRDWLLGLPNGWGTSAYFRRRGEALEYPWGGDGVTVPCWNYARCGEILTADTLEVDRVLPGWDGGTYSPENVRPSCAGCNRERNQGNPWTCASQRCLTGADLPEEGRRVSAA